MDVPFTSITAVVGAALGVINLFISLASKRPIVAWEPSGEEGIAFLRVTNLSPKPLLIKSIRERALRFNLPKLNFVPDVSMTLSQGVNAFSRQGDGAPVAITIAAGHDVRIRVAPVTLKSSYMISIKWAQHNVPIGPTTYRVLNGRHTHDLATSYQATGENRFER